MSLNIIIGERGWVFVGECERQGDQLVITNARNVRRWGTDAGLGQLAKYGPREGTILDDFGTVRLHVLAVVASVECNRAAWEGK